MAPRKKRRINEPKYMLTAWCYLMRYPLLLAGIATLVAASILSRPELYSIAIGLIVAGILSVAYYLINSRSVICRLCRAEFLKKLRCVRKSDVPSVLGSVRVPLALSVITRKSSIQCPYCGEKHPYFGKR